MYWNIVLKTSAACTRQINIALYLLECQMLVLVYLRVFRKQS